MIAMLVPMVSYDWKSHLVPLFDHSDLMNAMKSLTTPLALQRYVQIHKDLSSHCVDICRHCLDM